MVDAISSNQMVQQFMRNRGFGRRGGISETGQPAEGTWPAGGSRPAGPPAEGTGFYGPRASSATGQAFAEKYGRPMPNFAQFASADGATGAPEGLSAGFMPRPEGFGDLKLSASDGKAPQRPGRRMQDNPQLTAAMEALKQVLDQTKGVSEEEKQTQLVNWANAYKIPVPEAGSKWFWEV